MSAPIFRRGVLATVIVGAVVSFVAFLVLLVFGEGMAAPPSHGADGFSVSALGHRAFARLLAEAGVPVTTSRFDSAVRAGSNSLLIVAEPDVADDDPSAKRLFDAMVRRAGPTLVVLPKRTGFGDDERGGFVGGTLEDALSTPGALLAALDASLVVRRRSGGVATFDARGLGPTPTLPDPVQLVAASANLEPLVTHGTDVLLGRVVPKNEGGPPELYVLADPDLIATHGLVRGANALLAVSIVERLRPEGGGVVFDETRHGYDLRPSLWQALFRPPLLYATFSAFAAAIVLVVAGIGRFGRAKPPPPVIAPGKRFLVEHTADLLRQGGHSGHALERYLAATVHDAGRALHAPTSLDAKGLRAWLVRVERPGAGEASLGDVDARVAAAAKRGSVRQVVEAAMAVHAWKERTTNGPRDDS
jgi:hypothetical protein